MKKIAQVSAFYALVGAGIIGASYIGAHLVLTKVLGRTV